MLSLYRYIKSRRRMFFLILASLLLLGTFPVAFFAAFTYRYFRDYVASQVVSTQLDRLRQTESYVGAVLDEVEAKSYEFVLNVRFMELDTIGMETIGNADTALAARRVQEILQNLRDTNGFIQSAYYYNPNTDFLITSGGSLSRSLYYDTDWIIHGLLDQEAAPAWLTTRRNLDCAIRSDPESVRLYETLGIQSTPVLSFIRPVSRYVAPFGGYVVINLNVISLADYVAVFSREPQGEFVILNNPGRVLLSTSGASIGEEFGLEFLGDADSNPEGTAIIEVDGRRYLCYYLVGKNDWVYVFMRDAGALKVLYREIGAITIVLALALVAAGTAVSLIFSYRLYHPIDAILSDIGSKAGRIPGGKNELAFIHDTLGRTLRESAALRAFANRSSQAIKENTLRRLVSGQELSSAAIFEGLRSGEHRLPFQLFGMALVVVDADLEIEASKLLVAQLALIRYCETDRKDEIEILGVSDAARRIALLINTSSLGLARQTLKQIQKDSLEVLELTVRIIVGRFDESVTHASASYDQALAVLNSRVLEKKDTVIFRSDIDASYNGVSAYPFEIEERLIYHLKSGSITDVQRQFDRFLKSIFNSHEAERKQIESACIILISAVLRTVSLAGGDPGKYIALQNPYRDFLEQDTTVESIRGWFIRFLEATLDTVFVRGDSHGKYKRLIEKCIERHYNEDITLEQVASLTGISYSYIRKIFFTLFGTHFSDYINSFRVEKARGYLHSADGTIGEIAHRVGYTNQQRFYRNFKKLIGCTPKDYRLAAAARRRN